MGHPQPDISVAHQQSEVGWTGGSGEVLHLHVPADRAAPEVVGTRCAAAATPTIDDAARLHDLRLVVEELTGVLVDHAADGARLGVQVRRDPSQVNIEVSVAHDGSSDASRVSDVADTVVSAVAQDWAVTQTARTVTAQLVLSSQPA
ncbi:hypothetical protein [Salsipaludibacter albus]|uniref:hypothetical protein n=1 Tax=Salsipaludibacter albus TaxID=2849650 RepID=UPI001EE440C8|nr:hypothetical protein [Salsipaludibacter albus]MBY5161353.1 hypothetical protein [Salsipaludibacter albus]